MVDVDAAVSREGRGGSDGGGVAVLLCGRAWEAAMELVEGDGSAR